MSYVVNSTYVSENAAKMFQYWLQLYICNLTRGTKRPLFLQFEADQISNHSLSHYLFCVNCYPPLSETVSHVVNRSGYAKRAKHAGHRRCGMRLSMALLEDAFVG